MHIDCSVINVMQEDHSDGFGRRVHMICAAMRLQDLQILKNEELSMLFQLKVNDISKWNNMVTRSGVGAVENIASSHVDEEYKNWEENIVHNENLPTFWIYQAKSQIEKEKVNMKFSRLILPFCRLLAYNLNLSQIANAFCMDEDIINSWYKIATDNLIRFMKNF